MYMNIHFVKLFNFFTSLRFILLFFLSINIYYRSNKELFTIWLCKKSCLYIMNGPILYRDRFLRRLTFLHWCNFLVMMNATIFIQRKWFLPTRRGKNKTKREGVEGGWGWSGAEGWFSFPVLNTFTLAHSGKGGHYFGNQQLLDNPPVTVLLCPWRGPIGHQPPGNNDPGYLVQGRFLPGNAGEGGRI